MTDARRVACDALVRIEDGAYAHVVVPTMLRASGLDARDRAFVTDLVYGTVRSQRRLDELLAPHGRRPIESLDPGARAALRIGAQQLLNGVPAHAAVNATVEVAPPRARGYVNAVLRALLRSGPPWPEPSSEAAALSYPDWIVQRLRNDLGDAEAHAALSASNEPGVVSLRANPTRTTIAELQQVLVESGATVEHGQLVEDSLTVRGAGDLAAHPVVRDGRATPQDQASQAVIRFAAPPAGARVLDVAAAPGGKTTAAAEMVGPEGTVVAVDVDAGRLRLVSEAAQRLGLTNVSTLRADSRRLPCADASFDLVVVDAPCSGLGALRRRPDLRWRVRPEAPDELAKLQLELLVEAARTVRPGGTLVYSVCTLTRRETTDVADDALDRLDDFAVIDPPVGWRAFGQGAIVLPQDAGTDGMFVLGLRRE